MKTKPIPAIVMLIAGFITCMIGIFQRIEMGRFLKMLLVVLILFYILGGVVKLVIDMNFKEMEEPSAEEQSEETEEPPENVTEAGGLNEGREL